MSSIEEKFARIGTDHAPGQEARHGGEIIPGAGLRGKPLPGVAVDFSHGDVSDTAFAPAPGALDEFIAGEHR
ncbi:MAG: pyridoxal phosphate-dependent aminotransferase, partial [Gemmatimonadaceae bacterium]